MADPTWQSSAIDIHTHIVPAEFPAYAGSHAGARWPQMAAAQDCHHKNVMIAGKLFRTVSDECWSIERRLEAMADCGIGCQVLSPMPELFSYWLAADDAAALSRHVNDAMAAMVEEAPQKFRALGTVPLQDVDVALRELERLMKSGRFAGVEVGTNVNGTVIGDAKFAPFFAAAEDLGAAVFIHALHPVGSDRIVGPPILANYVGHPCETALAAVSLMTSGIVDRHPRLRLAFGHGGGALALLLPRLAHGWNNSAVIGNLMRRSPFENARGFFYDTLVYDEATLRFLAERFGVGQLCIGTDQPFDLSERAPLHALAQFSLAERELLYAGNARRFLGEG